MLYNHLRDTNKTAFCVVPRVSVGPLQSMFVVPVICYGNRQGDSHVVKVNGKGATVHIHTPICTRIFLVLIRSFI